MVQSKNIKNKVNRFVFSLHQEIIKTSVIGKKLLTAGRTNACLKDTYEELGRHVEFRHDRGEMDLDDPKIRSLLHTIKACKKDLKELEAQVNRIKFSAGPEDIAPPIIEEFKDKE